MIKSTRARYGMLDLALDTLRRRPLRAFIAVLSIAVALGGALVMVGTSQALEATLQRGYASRQVDLMVLQAGKSNPMTSRVDQTLAAEFQAMDGVARAQALLVDSLILGDDQSMLVYGWPPDYPELRVETPAGVQGLHPGQVLIGRAAATLTGIGAGARIELNLGSFEVMGTFDGGNFFESGVTFLFLELEPGVAQAEAEHLTRTVETRFPTLRVLTTEEFLDDNQLTSAVRGLGQVILITSVLLSALIISTIMVLTVSERRSELAVLRAIGWSRRRVSVLVLLETAVLATGAAAVGAVLGWVGLQASLAYLQSQGIHAQSLVTVQTLLWLSAAALAVAVLGAAIPVRHTMVIRVSEALREQ